jgi:NADPH-dependent curcumin reductase CurA
LLHKACPEGINVFFDNAGEEILDAVLPNMSKSGDIILCGSTATYNVWKNRGGLTNLSTLIFKSVRMYGIIYYGDKVLHETFPEMIELVNDGHIKLIIFHA